MGLVGLPDSGRGAEPRQAIEVARACIPVNGRDDNYDVMGRGRRHSHAGADAAPSFRGPASCRWMLTLLAPRPGSWRNWRNWPTVRRRTRSRSPESENWCSWIERLASDEIRQRASRSKFLPRRSLSFGWRRHARTQCWAITRSKIPSSTEGLPARRLMTGGFSFYCLSRAFRKGETHPETPNSFHTDRFSSISHRSH